MVGDHGITVANLQDQLPRFIASVGGGVDLRKFSGYVLVAQHDQPIFSQGYGLADRTLRRVPTADTSFRIGSVTKQFTAAAILKLAQDGKLATTDTVAKHLPEYRGPAKDVTIHQLLTHTAGVPNFTQDPAILARKAEVFPVDKLLALFQDQPLDFTPGSEYRYSNGGYAILGAIIERVSHKPYKQYLDEALFRPAQLTRTVVGDAPGDKDRAEGYQLKNGDIVPADPIDMSLPFAAGAVRSTAADLVRWHRALAGDTILTAASRAKLYRVEREHYAYGWVAQDVNGRATVWHNGSIDGFSSTIWRIPDADLVVVVLSNVVNVTADPIASAAIRAALGDKLELVPADRSQAADPAVVARLVGRYALTDDSKAKLATATVPQKIIDTIVSLNLTAGPTGLIAKFNGQDPVELAAQSDGSFFSVETSVRLTFDATAPGNAAAVTIAQGPLSIIYQRAAASPPSPAKPTKPTKP